MGSTKCILDAVKNTTNKVVFSFETNKQMYEKAKKNLNNIPNNFNLIYGRLIEEHELILLENYNDDQFINLGTGTDITIKQLVEVIKDKSGFEGKIIWDASKPDGMLKKCMDVSRIKALGWQPKITLEQGIEKIISEYRSFKV